MPKLHDEILVELNWKTWPYRINYMLFQLQLLIDPCSPADTIAGWLHSAKEAYT